MSTLKKAPIVIFALAILFAATTSCKKKDETRPEIKLESPAINQTFVRGKEIEVKAVFTDDRELSEYKIDIHENFDSHGHEKPQSEPWVKIIIGELSGKKQEINLTITIPETAESGPYHFDMKCLDAAGNESRYISRDIIIISGE
jgi:uncharacterized membrane protein